jgi:L-alanine-DL-glutamate epimerase-like enolase superfamily enzyme
VRGVTEAKKEVVWWGYDEVKLEVEEHRDGDGDGDAKHMERFTELRRSCSSEGRP